MDEKGLKVLLQWPTINHPLLTSFQIAKIPNFYSRSCLNFLDLHTVQTKSTDALLLC